MTQIPKIILYLVIIPLFLTGINKILASRRIKYIHGSISICFAFMILCFILREHWDHTAVNLLWNFTYSFEYFCTVANNVIIGQDFLSKLEAKLQNSELKIGNRCIIAQTTIVLVFVIGNKLYGFYHMMTTPTSELSSMPLFLISQITILTGDLECVWRVYLVSLVKNKITSIYKSLKRLYPNDWYATFLQEDSDTQVVKLLDTYKNVVDIAGDVTKSIQIPFLLRLLTELVGILVGVYTYVKVGANVDNNINVTVISFIVSMININIMNLLPCLIVEMIKVRCNDMKMILIQQSLRRNIKSKEKRALRHFAEHISQQAVSFKLFKSYELGADFVINVMRVSTTYSIFLLQSAKYKFF